MKRNKIFVAFAILMAMLAIPGCSDVENPVVDTGLRKGNATMMELLKDSIPVSNLSFSMGKNASVIGINTDGEWTAEVADESWCHLAVHAGYGYTNKLSYTKIEIDKNEGQARSTTLTVRSGDIVRTIAISQNGTGTDPNDPFMSAFTLVENLSIGYNLGNTLDSNPIGSWWDPTGKTPRDFETQWGQPYTTPEIIQAIADRGFKVIRVPVTWGIHCDDSDNIDPAWMNRVEEVVNMVINSGCYCIINVMHDTGAADNRWLVADLESYPTVSPRYKKIWAQIAERFKAYDDHLIFEAFNEILSVKNEWNDPADPSCYEAINRLEQDFVDVVRASGGNNAYRNLVVTTYSAGQTQAKLDGLVIPNDIHPNHILASIHCYDPYWFCSDSDDEEAQQWYQFMFDENCQKEIDDIFARVDKRFGSELGVPYIFGEFGAIGLHPAMAERVKYAQYMRKKFQQYNTTGLWWMGLIDRKTLEWYEDDIVNALMQ
jgi:endoglucanase